MRPGGQAIADWEARDRALDVSRSFIVQAPAGSGKTELLVRRFLALLATASRPEAVVAITFTRKAASEMRERISSALREAGGDTEPEEGFALERWRLARRVLERSADEGWGLLENPGRLEVFTIDSLCSRLAASLPLLTRFGTSPRSVDDAEPYYREAVRRTLARGAGTGALAEALSVVLERVELKLSTLEKQLIAMLGRREQWAETALGVASDESAARLLEGVEKQFERIIARRLEELADALDPELARLACRVAVLTSAELARQGENAPWRDLESPSQLGREVGDMESWRGLRTLLLTDRGAIRKRVSIREGAPPGSEAKEAYQGLLALALERLGAEDSFIVKLDGLGSYPSVPGFCDDGRRGLLAFFRVLLAAYAELWHVFREERAVDFSEIAVRAIEALGDELAPSDLLQRLDRRIDHLLVDEFQDTSLLQCNLLRALTSGWTTGDGRTLFLVGDPMQSIYRFRKAEVGLFLRASRERDLFPNLLIEPLKLEVNFRSDRRLIGWVNRSFSCLMGAEDDADAGLVSYCASMARPGAGEGESVELLGWDAETPDGDGRAAEGVGLAAMIADELLPAASRRGGSVAVLVRSRRHAVAIMRALRAREVPFRSGGMDRLGDRPVAQDLRSLVRFLVHRGDRLSGLALVRGPLVGLGVEDLCRLVEPDVVSVRRRDVSSPGSVGWCGTGYASVTELIRDEAALRVLSEDGRLRLRRFAGVVLRARALLGRVNLARLVEATWIELGGAAIADRTELLDARAFFDLLADVDRPAGLNLEELDRRLEGLSASGDPDVGVEFLTMHGAKGLEFDTVVLPGLNLGPGRGPPSPLAFETDAATGRMTVMAPRPARGRESADDSKYTLLGKRELERSRSEDLRLLYVAATRAKHRLVLSTPGLAPAEDCGVKDPASGSLLGLLWPVAESDYRSQGPPESGSRGSGSAVLLRIRSDFACPEAPPAVLGVVRSRSPSSQVGFEDEDSGAERLAMSKGTVLHGLLERVAREGLDHWGPERVQAEARLLAGELAGRGVLAEELDEAVEDIVETLRAVLDDDRGRWILADHPEANCEWKLTLCSINAASGVVEPEFFEASIDRSFVCDGVRWIIDYKSGRVPTDRDPYRGLPEPRARDLFLDEYQSRYRVQLERYGRLVRQLEPDREIRLALYLPQLRGGWREWAFRD
ncbi:MAG: UvrD-helicase domain-containing protein [Candidatus Binatia bacterium]